MSADIFPAETYSEVAGHDVIRDEGEALRRLEADEWIALDLETSGLSPFTDDIATVQMYGDQTGALVLLHVRGHLSPRLIEFLSSPKRRFIVHNGVAFDMPFLRSSNVAIREPEWYDTLVGETVVVGSGRHDISVSLRNTVKRRLGVELNKDAQRSHWMAEELTEEQVRYATSDVVHLPALRRSQLERARVSDQLVGLELEMKVVPVFAMMTFNGMPLSEEKLRKYLDRQQGLIAVGHQPFVDLFGEINANSPTQVKKAFAGRGIEVKSTAKEQLIDMAQHGGLSGQMATALLEYRAPAQRIKMYNDKWITKNILMGRVHSRFWQCSADTTRVTSSDPNLQQVPRDMRDPWGYEPGTAIVASDYSQIEVRVAAWVARDAALLEALATNDIHRTIASEVLGIRPEDVTPDQRKMSKAQTFTLLFGGGADTLYNYSRLQGSEITPELARDLVTRFFKKFTGLADFRTAAETRAQWSRESGRPVSITIPPGYKRKLFTSMATPQRILNTIVQGTAAAGIKMAMLECKAAGLDRYLSIQVHDELVMAVPSADAVEAGLELERCMVAGMNKLITAPVKVECRVGESWGDDRAVSPLELAARTKNGRRGNGATKN